MIKLIGFDSSKLGFEFVEYELIGFGPVTMIKYEWMAKVDGIRGKIRDRKNVLDSPLALFIYILAEHDGRLSQIRGLTRGSTERLENRVDLHNLLMIGLAANNQIISKEKRVDVRTIRTKSNPMNVVHVRVML